MRKTYTSAESVLRSAFAAPGALAPKADEHTDRVLRSTRLEDSIYADLRAGDDALDEVERDASEKLKTFPALSRDVFQSFYSLSPRRNDEDALSVTARKFNTHILTRCPMNTELLRRVRQSKSLVDISRYLGHFREIFAQGKKNGYAYGRGEKYSLELGDDLSKALTSELAMLATPETSALFLQKYRTKQIKQYRRREPIVKGMGDIICCLDESISTEGDPTAWGKAVAMTLLEIAADGKRRFALIHFAGSGSFQTDVFVPPRRIYRRGHAPGGRDLSERRHGF